MGDAAERWSRFNFPSRRVGAEERAKMPVPYSLDLRWRVVWSFICHRRSFSDIAASFNVCERTVRRYVDLFQRTGDVRPSQRRHGPLPLLGEYEQIVLFRLILANPGIYLCEIQEEIRRMFGVYVCISTICRTLKNIGCTRQAMHRLALQRSDEERARFMADISLYDVSMLVWLDESGCDDRNYRRNYGYSMRGIPPCDHRKLTRGTRYSAIPIVSLEGVHDVYLAQGSMNGERFANFVEECVLPILMPFNGTNPRSVVIMDNASIHHVQEISDLIETQAGARLCYLPPYSPDLNPVEGVFSQAKNIMKANDKLLQATRAPRAILAMIFGMISQSDCWGHISHCGYF